MVNGGPQVASDLMTYPSLQSVECVRAVDAMGAGMIGMGKLPEKEAFHNRKEHQLKLTKA